MWIRYFRIRRLNVFSIKAKYLTLVTEAIKSSLLDIDYYQVYDDIGKNKAQI